MICPKCKKQLKDGAKFCGYCGKKFNSTTTGTTNFDKDIAKTMLDIKIATVEEEAEERRIAAIKAENEARKLQLEAEKNAKDSQTDVQSNIAKCPKCGSTSLQAKTKGVSVGNAVTGALLIGPLGLLAGGIGMNDARIVCLNCGYEFKPGGN